MEFVTVQLVIFMGLIFRGLGNSDDFVSLYFYGVPITLIGVSSLPLS